MVALVFIEYIESPVAICMVGDYYYLSDEESDFFIHVQWSGCYVVYHF